MNMKEISTLGEAVKYWRLNRNIGQEDLGKVVGLTRQSIANIEKGKTDPPPETRRALEKALGIPFPFVMLYSISDLMLEGDDEVIMTELIEKLKLYIEEKYLK